MVGNFLWAKTPHCTGFTITLRHTTPGTTPLEKWSARRKDNTQHSQETDIHAGGRIWPRNPSNRAAEDQRLKDERTVL